MDDLDRRLIALLRADSRRPAAKLAADLGVSRATVRARIDRLVADGVISGFTISLGSETRGAAVRAAMMIEVEGRAADKVGRRLLGFPEVRALHSTNGRWDLVAELETQTLEAFDATLRRIRLLDGVSQTQTSILLASSRLAD